MSSARSAAVQASFRERMLAGKIMTGTFIKIPATQSVEIIGESGFDFVVIDAEHAPFHRGTIDAALLAARAYDVAGLVRVASGDSADILGALDCGAQGLLVPHVDSVEKARAVAAACRYRRGRRGFSGAGRAGRYGGLSTWDHVDAQDALVTVIAMIEDPSGVEDIEAIAAVDGIHGFFIGRGDLSVVTGAAAARAPEIMTMVERVSRAGRAAGKAISVMVDGLDEARIFRALGASVFIVDSDQIFLRRAASAALTALAPLE